MKAVRLVRPGLPLEEDELGIPRVEAWDVLVRVKAAGICHSDAHYRSGVSPVHPLPLTLGHEVAGQVERTGAEVTHLKAGDRVCLHYMVTCGHCLYCNQGSEQFCLTGSMIGKHRNGGYAEYISLPARSAFRLPESIPYEQGAILMCSSATSLHALFKSRLKPGETVAVFGAGGLGISAVQLARAFGAAQIIAVDIKESKLALAAHYGAIPVDASRLKPGEEIKHITGGRGVDVALELVGLPETMRQSVESLAIRGRAMMVGLSNRTFEIAPYQELINKEAEVIGVSDHLAQEIPTLIDWVLQGKLELASVVTRTIPLEAAAINRALDHLDGFGDDVRTVITP